VSFRDRKKHLDTIGDPWNGRTLEWATASPPPFYNFAVIPEVTGRDAWQAIKSHSAKASRDKPKYEDIEMPNNTALGIYVSLFIFFFAFAAIWHIAWLAIVGFIGALICFIIRAFDDHTEHIVTAEEIEGIETLREKQSE
jgi:cytochrome o ubiquinol oxidase subunit I